MRKTSQRTKRDLLLERVKRIKGRIVDDDDIDLYEKYTRGPVPYRIPQFPGNQLTVESSRSAPGSEHGNR